MSRHEPPSYETERNLTDPFHQPVIASRWLFAAGILLESLLQFSRHPHYLTTNTILGLICLYNIVALIGVLRIPRRLPWALLLALDLILVGIAAYCTDASRSPFLGQCYLVIFSGALLYGLTGGIVTGIASSLLVLTLALMSPAGIREDIRDLVPYLLVAGGFSGYLAQRLRMAFRHVQEVALKEEQRSSEEAAMHREMEMARRMQTLALPTAPLSFPGVSVAVRWEFAREVGGDFFSYITEGDRLGLVLGDVSGKGMPAALVATSIAYLLPWLRPLRDPAVALTNLDRELASRLPTTAFVTLAFAEVCPRDERVRLWSAGHPAALLWSRRCRCVREVPTEGPLLGVFGEWDGLPTELPFESGDVLVLYSDGLTETRNADGELFDTEGAAAVLARYAEGTAEEIADALSAAARLWGPQTDDRTILVCKRDNKPSEPPAPEGGGGL